MNDNDIVDKIWATLILFSLTIVCLTVIAVVLINEEDVDKIPACQEDEVIYFDDYPDGNMICVHMEEING